MPEQHLALRRWYAESLGLGMSGVRHPPANDAADHVTATRSARSATTRSATPFRECKHYQAVLKVNILGSCPRQICREHCLMQGLGFSSKKHETSTACSNLPTPSSTRHRHPHPSSHLFFPPLHSLNPLRLQVFNRLMLPSTLASPATFLLSSLSNWRVSMSFVRYTAAQRLKVCKTLRSSSKVFTVRSVKRRRLERCPSAFNRP